MIITSAATFLASTRSALFPASAITIFGLPCHKGMINVYKISQPGKDCSKQPRKTKIDEENDVYRQQESASNTLRFQF